MIGIERKGSCLCGEVKINATASDNNVGACHCRMCRKWGGGPFLAIDCGSEVAFEGDENISVFNSSDWAERGFCRSCGTHLYYRLKGNGQYIMPLGLFEDDGNFVMNH
ncbi:MAG: GFA family protein [Sneathiella sp.]|nr:GFA family protein [Sneathiella sp.]MDF2365957.1 GFA family protein [Sneathiella sp.]